MTACFPKTSVFIIIMDHRMVPKTLVTVIIMDYCMVPQDISIHYYNESPIVPKYSNILYYSGVLHGSQSDPNHYYYDESAQTSVSIIIMIHSKVTKYISIRY